MHAKHIFQLGDLIYSWLEYQWEWISVAFADDVTDHDLPSMLDQRID